MIWDERQDNDMLNFFQKMISLRKLNHDFKQVDIDWLKDTNKILAYRKGNTYFFINNNDSSESVILPETLTNRLVENLYEGTKNTLKSELLLAPYEFKIFKN